MTQENKQLLLKDLCSRLLYGVILHIEFYDLQGDGKLASRDIELTPGNIAYCFNNSHWVSFKPYLRPMSSMTEEELEELKGICSIYIPTDSKNIGFEDYGILVFTHHLIDNSYSFKLNLNVIDWLNKKMFDYQGLIPMGLALEAPEDTYK